MCVPRAQKPGYRLIEELGRQDWSLIVWRRLQVMETVKGISGSSTGTGSSVAWDEMGQVNTLPILNPRLT